MKKIDIRDIRSEEILAVNRGENTLFQRRENLSKHTSYARERMQYDAIRSDQVEQILSAATEARWNRRDPFKRSAP